MIAAGLSLLGGRVTACDLSMGQLRQEAILYLEADYPGRVFGAAVDADSIDMGDTRLGLQKLLSQLCSDPDFRWSTPHEEQTRAYLAPLVMAADLRDRGGTSSWDDAKSLVSLQFLPSGYLKHLKEGDAIVSRPFIQGVELAVVMTLDHGYAYLHRAERQRWQVGDDEIFATALRNLDQRTKKTDLVAREAPDSMLTVEKRDGFDAVRLLLPWVREQAAATLGEPFLASISHRDFLVAWSTSNRGDFQKFARERVSESYADKPQRLSGAILKVWADGRIEVSPETERSKP